MGQNPKDQSEGQEQDGGKPSKPRNSPWECRDSALATSYAQVSESSWTKPLF